MPDDSTGPRPPHLYDHLRQDMARLALAGLRRPVYVATFQKHSRSRSPGWTAEIMLDGYQRSLKITISPRRRKADVHVARLHGLRPFANRLDIALSAPARRGPVILSGAVALGPAWLHLSIISSQTVNGRTLPIGQLEIEHGNGGTRS